MLKMNTVITHNMWAWKWRNLREKWSFTRIFIYFFMESRESMTGVLISNIAVISNKKCKMPTLRAFFYNQIYDPFLCSGVVHRFLVTGREGKPDETVLSITKTSFMTSRWLWRRLWRRWWQRGVCRVSSEQSLSVLLITLLICREMRGCHFILKDK